MASAARNPDPIVIVTSLGAVSASDIINNIRRQPADVAQHQLNGGEGRLVGHRYEVVTKYYTSHIQFVRYDRPLDTLPAELQAAVEGMLIYFDAENRDILKLIDNHLQYAKEHSLQFFVLICDRLADDPRLGMTHREVKQCTQMFIDIIELGRQREEDEEDESASQKASNPTATLVSADDDGDDDDDQDNVESKASTTCDHHDPVGYAELVQVLQNNIWSNVDMQELLNEKSRTLPSGEESDFRHELADFLHLSSGGSINRTDQMFADAGDQQFVEQVAELLGDGLRLGAAEAETTKTPKTVAADVAADPADEHQVEAELQSFEKMLQEISAFKETAQGLSRNERFAYTSFFAEAMDKLIAGDAPPEGGSSTTSSDNEKDEEEENGGGGGGETTTTKAVKP